MPDSRQPEPIGPIAWDIVAPIMMPELERTIAQMTPGSPGPDGMVLSQFKQMPREAIEPDLTCGF